MKKLCFVIFLQIAVITLFAQRHDLFKIPKTGHIITTKNMLEYEGYIINLIPAMPGSGHIASYGFDILKGNKQLVHQPHNPLPFHPAGYKKKRMHIKLQSGS